MKHAKKEMSLILAILSIVVVVFFIVSFPLTSFAENNENVATNTRTGEFYSSIKDALAGASAGDTIDVIKGNPKGNKDERFQIGVAHGIQNYITLQKSQNLTDEVCLDCDYEYTVAYFYNGATFNDLSFNFGKHLYHGLDGVGILTFNNCKLYGLQHGYVTSYFNDCTFINEDELGEYNMWTYSAEVHYTNCEFQSKGKFINVYNSGINTNRNIILDGCKFKNVGAANKSAVNVKATAINTPPCELFFTVKINNCSLEGLFPTSNRLNNKLVMIDDGNSSHVSITLDNKVLYPEQPQSITDLRPGDSKTITTSLADPGFSYTQIAWTSSNENAITLSQISNNSNEITGNSVKATRVGNGFSRVVATDELYGVSSIYYFGNPVLSFNMQGHGQQIASQSFDPKDETDLPIKPKDPTCEGYEFEGWYTTPEYTSEFDFTQLVKDDTTIYAKWKEVQPGPGPGPGPEPTPVPEPQNPEFVNQTVPLTLDSIIVWQFIIILFAAIISLLTKFYPDRSKIQNSKHAKKSN